MTPLDLEVLDTLRPSGRLLYPETIAAIMQRPRTEIDKAVERLRAQHLAARNRCGQWYSVRAGQA